MASTSGPMIQNSKSKAPQNRLSTVFQLFLRRSGVDKVQKSNQGIGQLPAATGYGRSTAVVLDASLVDAGFASSAIEWRMADGVVGKNLNGGSIPHQETGDLNDAKM